MTAPGSGEAGAMMDLVIYGAGGHGQVVAEAARLSGTFRVLGFIDDTLQADKGADPPILSAGDARVAGAAFHVAVGGNAGRARLFAMLAAQGRRFASVVHPTAFVSPSATLGRGVFVGPRAVVHAEATLGDGTIVNSGAIVEHHCRIDAFAHVAPGVVMGGGVVIGEGALVGLGARVLPKVRIGDGATVGAGAILLRDVPKGARVVGVH